MGCVFFGALVDFLWLFFVGFRMLFGYVDVEGFSKEFESVSFHANLLILSLVDGRVRQVSESRDLRM